MAPPDQPPEGRRIVGFRIRVAEIMAVVAVSAILFSALITALKSRDRHLFLSALFVLPAPPLCLEGFFVYPRETATDKLMAADRFANRIIDILLIAWLAWMLCAPVILRLLIGKGMQELFP